MDLLELAAYARARFSCPVCPALVLGFCRDESFPRLPAVIPAAGGWAGNPAREISIHGERTSLALAELTRS